MRGRIENDIAAMGARDVTGRYGSEGQAGNAVVQMPGHLPTDRTESTDPNAQIAGPGFQDDRLINHSGRWHCGEFP